jgi:hypothetical protein
VHSQQGCALRQFNAINKILRKSTYGDFFRSWNTDTIPNHFWSSISLAIFKKAHVCVAKMMEKAQHLKMPLTH